VNRFANTDSAIHLGDHICQRKATVPPHIRQKTFCAQRFNHVWKKQNATTLLPRRIFVGVGRANQPR
jgi:hypothetical protein